MSQVTSWQVLTDVIRPSSQTQFARKARQKGIAEMDNSLRLLRCSAIELMQIHNLVDCNTYLATPPL